MREFQKLSVESLELRNNDNFKSLFYNNLMNKKLFSLKHNMIISRDNKDNKILNDKSNDLKLIYSQLADCSKAFNDLFVNRLTAMVCETKFFSNDELDQDKIKHKRDMLPQMAKNELIVDLLDSHVNI
jgi:hypothetical protein